MTWERFLYECNGLIGIALSLLLGFAIGLERKFRAKEAGIRTHTIVCVGAALVMVVSKYAFDDVQAYDAARIAAQVVSGVGFLGAGIIVYRHNEIHGLTTAAGVWATAGVGLAAGGGMYIVATASTLLIIAVQCLLHSNFKLFRSKRFYRLQIKFDDTSEAAGTIKSLFGVERFKHLTMKRDGDGISYSAVLLTDKEFSSTRLKEIMDNYPFITAVERCDED